MARQRVQVGELRQERLRPTASPVDTFAPSPAGRTLEGLAKGLAEFAGPASQLAATVADKYIARQQERGKLDARDDDAKEAAQSIKQYKEGVKSGAIKRADNPWFKASYSEEKGRLEAQRWHADFVIKSADSLSEAENLEDFEKAVADHQAQWFKDHPQDDNQFFRAGFSNLATALTENERLRFASRAASNVEKHATDTYHAGLMADVEQMRGDGVSIDDIAAYVTKKARTAIGLGASGTAINRATWQAVVRAAVAMDDPLLAREVLEKVEGGAPGSTLARLPEAADAIEQTSNAIASKLHSDREWQEQATKRQKEHALDDVLRRATTALEANLDNPAGVDLTALRREAIAIDPTFGEQVVKLRDAYVSRTFEDVPDVAAAAYTAVDGLDPNRPGYFLTKADARTLLTGKKQITIATYNDLISRIDRRDNDPKNSASRTLLDNDWLKELQRRIQGALDNDIGESSPQYAYLSQKAPLMAARMFQQWVESGGKPDDPKAGLQFVVDTFDSIYATMIADPMNLQAAERNDPTFGKGGETGDWHKERVIGAAQAQVLRSNLDDIAAGHATRLSRATVIVLRRYGVEPDYDAALEFLKTQEVFLRQ
jgi:hypothetical protein